MPKKIKPDGATYRKRLFEAMLDDFGDFYCACKNCGNPTHKSYICRTCRHDPI